MVFGEPFSPEWLLGLSKQGCEVGEVMMVTPPGRKQPRVHTPGSFVCGGFLWPFLLLLKGQPDMVQEMRRSQRYGVESVPTTLLWGNVFFFF